MAESTKVSAGVDELIAQLRDDGVKAARQEADRILKEARDRAARMLESARKEVHDLKAKNLVDIQTEKAASEEALKLAARDTILRLGNEIRATFEGYVKRLVAEKLSDEDFLKEIILTIARKTATILPEDNEILILLSGGASEAGKKASDAAEQKFRRFVLKTTDGILREGIDIKAVGDKFAGMKVQLKGTNIEIELTDQAIAGLLMRHLISRFRKIMTGQE